MKLHSFIAIFTQVHYLIAAHPTEQARSVSKIGTTAKGAFVIENYCDYAIYTVEMRGSSASNAQTLSPGDMSILEPRISPQCGATLTEECGGVVVKVARNAEELNAGNLLQFEYLIQDGRLSYSVNTEMCKKEEKGCKDQHRGIRVIGGGRGCLNWECYEQGCEQEAQGGSEAAQLPGCRAEDGLVFKLCSKDERPYDYKTSQQRKS